MWTEDFQHTYWHVRSKADQTRLRALHWRQHSAATRLLSDSEPCDAGGSSGIGKAVAQAFDANGAVVTVLARRKERLDAEVAQLKRVTSALCRTVHASMDGQGFPQASARTPKAPPLRAGVSLGRLPSPPVVRSRCCAQSAEGSLLRQS